MLRTNAKYAFGLEFARFMPLNADLTTPTTTSMLGGIGPFDFSGATSTAAVPLTIKIDNGTAETVNIDVSTGVGSVDESAVTVAELFAAINAETPTDMTASADVTTGRIKLAYSGAGSPDYIQVYGEAALISEFGQGYGLKFIKSDTLKSIGDSPTMKDVETFTTTDSNGLDTEVMSDGYRKGFTATIVDSAEDWELLALIEGGTYDSANGTYDVPTSETTKPYFYIEAYYSQYSKGTNKEADITSYVKKTFRTCSGVVGDKTHERGFADGNYTITGTSYKDASGNIYGDTQLEQLTVEEYEALDLYNV